MMSIGLKRLNAKHKVVWFIQASCFSFFFLAKSPSGCLNSLKQPLVKSFSDGLEHILFNEYFQCCSWLEIY